VYHRPPNPRIRKGTGTARDAAISSPPPFFNGAGRDYPVDTSHPRPFFDSKWNRQGSAGFVLESKPTVFRNSRTKNWLQLRCVHPIGAGVGVKLCSAAPTPSRSRPASAANQQAPTLACCLGRLIAEMQAERHIEAGGRRPRCGRPGPSLSLGVWHRGLAWSGRSSVVVLNR
jgi:hypothetical protein